MMYRMSPLENGDSLGGEEWFKVSSNNYFGK